MLIKLNYVAKTIKEWDGTFSQIYESNEEVINTIQIQSIPKISYSVVDGKKIGVVKMLYGDIFAIEEKEYYNLIEKLKL